MKTLIATALLAVSTVASAEWYTGNELLAMIEDQQSSFRRGLAAGYITGVTTAAMASGQACVPNGVTIRQMEDTVKRRLTAAPTVRHQSASTLIGVILEIDFPCQAKPKTELY